MLLCQFITLFWELKGGGGPFFWKWIPWPDLLEFHFWAIYVFMPKVTKANRILDPDPISMGIPSSVSIWNRSYRSYTGLLSGRVMQKIATLGTGKWLNGTSRMHCQLLAGLADRRSELYSFCFPRVVSETLAPERWIFISTWVTEDEDSNSVTLDTFGIKALERLQVA